MRFDFHANARLSASPFALRRPSPTTSPPSCQPCVKAPAASTTFGVFALFAVVKHLRGADSVFGLFGGGVIGLTSQGAGGSPAVVLPRLRSALLQVAVVRLPWLNLAFSTVPRGAVVQ